MAKAARELLVRYSDEQLQLLVDFQRQGREVQERHAEWLRDRLREPDRGAPERDRVT